MILDLSEALRRVESIEQALGVQLDEDDLFSTIFNNMEQEQEHRAIQKIEEQLLCVALDLVVDYNDLMFGGYMNRVLATIRDIAVRFHRELKALGVYRDQRCLFAYHSRPHRNAAYFVERKHHVRDYPLR